MSCIKVNLEPEKKDTHNKKPSLSRIYKKQKKRKFYFFILKLFWSETINF